MSVTGQGVTASFIYDGDGKRVKSTINSAATYFVGVHYEVSGEVVTKYYYAGTSRVAMKTGGTVYYLLSDHLGSTSITTNTSGNVVSEMRYSAWGSVRYQLGSAPSEYTFTGQYSDSVLGLMDYVARRYDPQVGRFISPDSIVPTSVQGGQAWDRYTFTNNNPLKYTDPSGHFVNLVIGAAVGTIVGIGVVAINAAIHPEVHLTSTDLAIAAGVGAAAGLLISTGVGAAAGTALGATLFGAGIGAAASGAGYTIAAGEDYNSAEMVANATIGAVAGAASANLGQLVQGTSGMTKAMGILDQAGISMTAGYAQQAVGDLFDGHNPTSADLSVAGTTGVMAFAFASAADLFFPGGGQVAGPLIRSSFIETGNNWLTRQTTAVNDNRTDRHDYQCRNACCSNP